MDKKIAAKTLEDFVDELKQKSAFDAAGFNHEKTLVIIVDMIVGFCFEGALASPRNKAVIAPIKKLLDTLPKSQKVFVRDCHSKDAGEFQFFPSHCCNEKESALVPELQKYEGIDLPKNSTNGFFELAKKVSDLAKFDNIVVVGVCTDICVLQLALSLRAYLNESDAKTTVSTIISCIETYDAPWHNAELYNLMAVKLMEQAGVAVYN